MKSDVISLTEIRSVFQGLEQANGYGQPNVGADYADTQLNLRSETPGPHTLV